MNNPFMENTTYEFSFNPEQQFLHKRDSRYNCWHSNVCDHLRKLVPYATFHLRTELGTPNVGKKSEKESQPQMARYHCHGYILFRANKLFQMLDKNILYDVMNSFSTWTINDLRSEHWHQYITKQESYMLPNLGIRYFIDDVSVQNAKPLESFEKSAKEQLKDLARALDEN